MSSDRFPEDLQKLAEQFLASGWTELRVKSGDTEILFSLDPQSPGLGSPGREMASPAAAPVQATPQSPVPSAPAAQEPVAADPSWIPVLAPNLGTFYRSPKPGAPPFVEVGTEVEATTEICLLEVMKLFTSVKAGRAGKIAQVSATDSELVEAGQVLFYLLPAEA